MHSHSAQADRHRRLAIDYENLIADIRGRQGFEKFMRPKQLSELLASFADSSGPVVSFNMDEVRCDALVLLPTGALFLLPLPTLSLNEAERLRSEWLFYLNPRRVRERASKSLFRETHTSRVEQILKWLWRRVVHPVLQSLGLDRVVSHYCFDGGELQTKEYSHPA